MKTIKNIFKSKITYAILACLLLVGIFAGLTTLASNDPVVTIEGKNVNHAESARLVYTVKIANITESDIVANADKVKMHFWTSEPTAPDAAPELTSTEYNYEVVDGGVLVTFESYNIAPKAMTNSVYCAAEYNGVYSDVCRYSVFEYLCEASLTANTDQQALYAAMTDYIKYAQMYLGVDGTEFPSPDDLGYVKLTNCYIEVNGVQVRDGVVPRDNYDIYSDFEYARYVNKSGAICQYNRTDDQWGADLLTNDALAYTAYEAFKFTTPVVENTELIRAIRTDNDGAYAYSPVAYYDGIEGYGVIYPDYMHKNDYYILVPKLLEGKTFAYWADADGNVVSTQTVYTLNDKMADFEVGNLYEITLPTPVYTANTSADKTVNLNDATAATNGTTTVTQNTVDGANNGLIHDSTGKTAQGNGQAGIITGTAEGDVALNKIVVTYKHTIESAAGTYDSVIVSDLFIGKDYNYTGHYQNYLRYNGANLLMFHLNACNKGSASADITKGYFIKPDSNGSELNLAEFNDLNRCFMKYGVENTITLIADVEKNADGTVNLINVSYYANGLYVGSARARWAGSDKIADDVAYSSTVQLNFASVIRTKSKLTVWDAVVYEFDSDYVIAE